MQKVIENVIKDFDFEKVHKVMVVTNWVWLSSDGVPTITELILCAMRLLEEASEMEPGCLISTGGFTATKLYDDEYGDGLSLKFIVTESKFYENKEQDKYYNFYEREQE